LPNFEEYLHLPEYVHLVNLLAKGVAIHHSGMIPILREIVELLFAKGYIKMLFCTESVAIGLNLPVKTTIFTDINKHDGVTFRTLHGHEYTQAAGRAGRLGLDTVGNVIHLNNLFKNVDSIGYKQMLKGSPQTLTSKFKISYNLLLNLIDVGDRNISQFASKSMIKTDVDSEIAILHSTIETLNDEINKLHDVLQHNKTPQETIELYIDLLEKRKTAVNKKRKEIDREIGHLTQHFKTIESDKKLYETYADKCNAFNNTGKFCNELQHWFETQTNNILKLLCEEEFVETNDNLYSLTVKGMFATHIRELPSLTFANIIANDTFNELSSKQLISIFSCFTNIKVSDELQAIIPKSDDAQVLHVIELIKTKNDYYVDKELKLQINTGVDYTMHFDLIDYVSEWCDCECIEDCKFFLQKIESEKGIFLGEFTKALLKINNISLEIEKIAELLGNLPLLSKLKEIPLLTLKYVVTNQSLYV